MNTVYRLNYIAETNPEWFSYIMDFVESNNEFLPYLYMAAIQPTNQKHEFFPTTVKQAILYYICYAGVRSEFGQKLWLIVKDLTTKEQVLASTVISPKKKEYLSQAIQIKDDFSIDQLKTTKIAGIGVSGIAFIHKNFSSEIASDLVEYTDIGVLGGLQKIYKLASRPSPKEALEIISKWKGKKSVGNMFCTQVYHYA